MKHGTLVVRFMTLFIPSLLSISFVHFPFCAEIFLKINISVLDRYLFTYIFFWYTKKS